MPLCLVPIESGNPIVMDKAIVFVGRDPECDVILLDSRKVSRKHCCIALVDNQLFVRDLDSMNGVWINGERVRREAGIEIGDELAIGDVRFETQEIRSKKKKPKPRKDPGLQTMESDTPPPVRTPESADDMNLSMDFPIAIPDEGESFAVDASDSEIVKEDGPDAEDEDEEADKLIMQSDEY